MSLRADILKFLFLGMLGLAILIGMYALAAAPTRIASRLGLRGLKRQRALAEPGGWSTIEPLVRWLGVRVSGILPEEQRNALDEQITASDAATLTALFDHALVADSLATL